MELKRATLWQKITGAVYTKEVVLQAIEKENSVMLKDVNETRDELYATHERMKTLNKLLYDRDKELDSLRNKQSGYSQKLAQLQQNLTSTIADYKEQLKKVMRDADSVLRKSNTEAATKMLKLSKQLDKLKDKKNKLYSSKKLKCKEIKEIRSAHDAGADQNILSDKYRVSESTISRIINKKTYKECV